MTPRRMVFGAINIGTGHRVFLARVRQRGEDFRALPPVIASHYRGWHVALVLDEDPSHTVQASRALTSEAPVFYVGLDIHSNRIALWGEVPTIIRKANHESPCHRGRRVRLHFRRRP
jgi:hypothetical protein